MAKKISYDPDTIASLVTACANAKNDLDKAVESLNLVQSHADWTCKEKDEIDDMVRAMKKLVQTTQLNQDNFFSAIRRIAELYTGKENSINSWFSSVDELIGKIVSIKASVVATIGAHIGVSSGLNINSIVSSAKETVSSIASSMKEFIDNMNTGIHVHHMPQIVNISAPISNPISSGILPTSWQTPIISSNDPISVGTGIWSNIVGQGGIGSSGNGLSDIIGTGLPSNIMPHQHAYSSDGIPLCKFMDIAATLKTGLQ